MMESRIILSSTYIEVKFVFNIMIEGEAEWHFSLPPFLENNLLIHFDMINSNNYNFEVSLTTKSFDHKPDSSEVKNLKFTRTTTSVGDFCESIIDGYGYVGVFDAPGTFTMHDKTSSNFSHSWFTSIDIDHSQVEMQDMVDDMKFKPSIAYTSCSNGQDGDCRFRFVYLFDEPITSQEEYCNTVFAILYSNGIGVGDVDPKSFEVQQYFNGNGTGSIELISNNIIYSKVDYNKYYIDYYNIKNKKKDIIKSDNKNKLIKDIQYDSNDTFEFTNKEFEKDFNDMSLKEIVEKYVGIFPDIQRTPLEDVDEDTMAVMLTEDFVSIKRNWRNINGERRLVKIKDGYGRRNKLFTNGILRRLINPDITYDNLVYNLLFEFYHYYTNENARNIIGKQEIREIADSVMREDLNKYSELKGDDREFEVNQEYCIKNNISKRSASNMFRKMIRWEKIGELYDGLMSDKENLEVMHQNGLKISSRTLKRWREANGMRRYKTRKGVDSSQSPSY